MRYRKAAILLELSRYGVTVEMLDGFGEWADTLAKTKQWRTAIDGTGDSLISNVVGTRRGWRGALVPFDISRPSREPSRRQEA